MIVPIFRRASCPHPPQPARPVADPARARPWLLSRLRLPAIAVLSAIGLLPIPAARADGASEAQLKAAYLVNFLKYVDWPAGSAGATICVYGRDNLIPHLRVYEGKSILGQEIRIRRVTQSDQLADCQELFIPDADGDQAVTLFKWIGRQSVLTISDSPSFIPQGGAITLTRVDNRLVFDVNMSAITRAGLKINPQMLRLAREVTGVAR